MRVVSILWECRRDPECRDRKRCSHCRSRPQSARRLQSAHSERNVSIASTEGVRRIGTLQRQQKNDTHLESRVKMRNASNIDCVVATSRMRAGSWGSPARTYEHTRAEHQSPERHDARAAQRGQGSRCDPPADRADRGPESRIAYYRVRTSAGILHGPSRAPLERARNRVPRVCRELGAESRMNSHLRTIGQLDTLQSRVQFLFPIRVEGSRPR